MVAWWTRGGGLGQEALGSSPPPCTSHGEPCAEPYSPDLEEVRSLVRSILRSDDCSGLAAACNARNASASTRNGLIHYFGSDAAIQAFEAGRTMLLTGGSPLDVLSAVNRAGAAACDPARPSRGHRNSTLKIFFFSSNKKNLSFPF